MLSLRRQRHVCLNKKKMVPWLLMAPSLLGVGIFVLLPFCDVVRRSFLDAMGENFAGTENYITVFQNESFRQAVTNTISFLGVCLPLLLLLSFLCALGVNGMIKGQGFFKLTFLFPMAVPVASLVLVFKLFLADGGYLNQIADFLSKPRVHWMEQNTAFGVLVFTYLWKNIGYDMILWLSGLSCIPKEYYEAAKIDGCGSISCFRYITIPMLRSTFFVTAVLSLVNAFRVYREAYLISGDYPQEHIYMLQHLFSNWFVNLDIQKMSTASVMLAVVLTVVILLLKSCIKEEDSI